MINSRSYFADQISVTRVTCGLTALPFPAIGFRTRLVSGGPFASREDTPIVEFNHSVTTRPLE